MLSSPCDFDRSGTGTGTGTGVSAPWWAGSTGSGPARGPLIWALKPVPTDDQLTAVEVRGMYSEPSVRDDKDP
jgi:hypothetical protein